MAAARSARVFEFGEDDPYQAVITDPRGSDIGIGAVFWGMGVAQMRAAKALARLGITGMQIRRLSRPRQGGPGITRGIQAMDLLASQRDVTRFILMGNCGYGAASFNIALRDPRVVGLILSNVHVSEVISVGARYKSKLSSPDSWRRLLTGRLNLKGHAAGARLLGKRVLGRVRGVGEDSLVQRQSSRPDFTLPGNIADRLVAFGERGVSTLLFFAHTDPSLHYFQDLYGRSLDRSNVAPSVTAEVLPTTNHWIAKDDEASAVAAQSIYRWAEQRWGPDTRAPRAAGSVGDIDGLALS
jgi:hypothetical protein